MRNGYTPPPGYDGSRFVRNRDRVTAIGDGDYTLSVGGIPRSGYREDQKLRSDMRDDAGARRTRGGYRTPHRSTSGSGEEERAVRDADGTRTESSVGAPGHGGGNAPTVPDGTDSAGACAVCRDADAAPSCGGKCAERKDCPYQGSVCQDDLMLVLLTVLLAGEKNTGDLIIIFALLLGIR